MSVAFWRLNQRVGPYALTRLVQRSPCQSWADHPRLNHLIMEQVSKTLGEFKVKLSEIM